MDIYFCSRYPNGQTLKLLSSHRSTSHLQFFFDLSSSLGDNVYSVQKKIFGLALSIILTIRLPQVLDKLDVILSVCTNVILSGNDVLNEEESSGDNMSSSRPHDEGNIRSKKCYEGDRSSFQTQSTSCH